MTIFPLSRQHLALRSCAATGLLLCLCATRVVAQEVKPPNFVMHTVDGEVGVGPIAGLTTTWDITLADGKRTKATGKDLMALRRVKPGLPAFPEDERIWLTNGDVITCAVQEFSGERLRFQPRLLAAANPDADISWQVPVSSVSMIWVRPPEGSGNIEDLRRRLLAERRRGDVLLLSNGDQLEGTVSSLSAQNAVIDMKDKKGVSVKREKIAVLVFGSEFARKPQTKGQFARVVLVNGCRLSIAAASVEEKGLACKTVAGDPVFIPLDQLVALDMHGGRSVYLSDLKPKQYEHTPYLGVSWPYRFDASVLGRDMYLNGGMFDKGIGMHSESRLIFELAGKYLWFESLVGLDSRSGREGSVQIQVLVDGKKVNADSAKELSGSDAPRSVRVNLSGAKELTLVVLFGNRGDVQDHVNWADARLLKR